MKVLVVSRAEVARLLSMRDCVPLMEAVLKTLAAGGAVLPLRPLVWLPDRSGVLAAMPAYLDSPRSLGLKAITVFPGNEGTGLDSHLGAVLLFHPADGRLLAMMDGSEITAVRTAAVSGAATRALARPEATRLALLGSGTQARTHLSAMREVRPIASVKVHSRSFENARAFARAETERHGIPVEAVATAEEAVRGADVVCTVTSSREPVLLGEWLAPGAHLNAVGVSVASSRELDAAAVAKARLFVDLRESALAEAGDFLLARRDGAVDDAHIVAELGEVLSGTVEGRRSPEEITLFKSVGLAVEDVASADLIYRRALETGAGTAVEL